MKHLLKSLFIYVYAGCISLAASAQSIRVALVQPHLAWGDVEANLVRFAERVERCEPCDMIVFPELFVSGCEMKKSAADTKPQVAACYERVREAMRQWALAKQAVVIGSTVYSEEGKYYNRLIAALPDGTFLYYDKHHCFKRGSFTPGELPLVFSCKGVRMATYICYDLRFPEWSRNEGRYDVALYVANWPASRRDDWNRLLKERAEENAAYVIGVNCAGSDPYGLYYEGDTQWVRPDGTVAARCEEGADTVLYGVITVR